MQIITTIKTSRFDYFLIGEQCESTFDACLINPCTHDGDCTSINDTAVCDCKVGFSGELCEIDLDECNSDPCLGGGRCEQLDEGGYTCACPVGLTGT